MTTERSGSGQGRQMCPALRPDIFVPAAGQPQPDIIQGDMGYGQPAQPRESRHRTAMVSNGK